MNETSSTSVASVSDSPVDQIAQLFASGEEKEKKEPEVLEADDFEEESAEDESPTQRAESEESDEENEQDVTWASVLGTDESKLVLDDDGNFKGVKVKIDGAESTVDINTLIAGYQTAKSTTQKSQALADERRQFEATAAERLKIIQQRLEESEAFTQLLQNKMMSDYQGVNWQQLRMENPSEYAALMVDYQSRQNDINNMVHQIRANRENVSKQQAESAEVQKKHFFQEQAKRAIEMFPEWSDKEKARRDFNEMKNFVAQFGFSDDEFSAVSDPRVLAVLKNAMTVDKAQQQSVEKIHKPIPKIRKSTSTRSTTRATKLDRLVKRAASAKGSQKRAAQTDAIAELLMSG